MTTLIKNGLIIDPASETEARINLILENGKVREITSAAPSCDEVIDARGLIVSPGFIDIHMHEEAPDTKGNIQYEALKGYLRMGVTTAFGGNCGENYVDPQTYFDYADTHGLPVNMGLFAGAGWAREQAGHQDKYTPATPEEIADMRTAIQSALRAGCSGVSYGIRYYPGSSREELMACAEPCVPGKRLITAHVRDDADNIVPSIREFLEIGEMLGLPMQVSHIGSMGGFGQMRETLDVIAASRMNGFDATADCYPYTAFSTLLGSTTYDEGWTKRYNCDLDVLMFCDGKYAGQRATAETFAEMRRDRPGTVTVCYVMREEDIDMAMSAPGVMLASDGLVVNGAGHPRACGTFPRLISEYVKKGKLSMYEAIRKMTAMPAEKLRLKNKGTLKAGSDADIVLFDPEAICDKATFTQPSLPPAGIEYVLIGGKTVSRRNTILCETAGRSIRCRD